MKQKPTKKEHVVPRSYLKRFSTQKSEKLFEIGVVQNNRKHYISNITDVGYIKNYHDDDSAIDPKHWEAFFSQEIEPLYGNYLDHFIVKIKLTPDCSEIFTSEDKYNISKLIVSQWSRVPTFIEHYQKNMFPKILENTSEKIKSNIFQVSPVNEKYFGLIDNIKAEFAKEIDTKQLILSHIFDEHNFKRYIKLLGERSWNVYYNNSDIHFITSDNPVLMSNTSKKTNKLCDNGLANKNTYIFFPLSPRIAVEITPLNRGFLSGEITNRKIYLDSNKNKFIESKNQAISLQSYTHTFFPLDMYNQMFPNG